jgi:hypothetical protein
MNEEVKKLRDRILEQEVNQFNHRKHNKLNDEIQSIFKTLRNNNRLSELEPLLYHESVNVAATAAKYFYLEDKQKSLETLERIKSREGFDPFVINDLIKRLKNGEINFDY